MDSGNGPLASVVVKMVRIYFPSRKCSPIKADWFWLDDWEAGKAEVVLWSCTGTCDSDPPKRGYYLQHLKPVSADISSTNLRQVLVQTHLLNEATLNQLSTEALLERLGPILREN